MSIEETNKIDFLGFDKISGECILTISDHMEWDVESNHILYLQNKLNVYLEYIESGQLFKEYPKAKDVKLRIDLVMKYEPINYSFLNHVKSELKRLGYQFDFKHLKNKQ